MNYKIDIPKLYKYPMYANQHITIKLVFTIYYLEVDKLTLMIHLTW